MNQNFRDSNPDTTFCLVLTLEGVARTKPSSSLSATEFNLLKRECTAYEGRGLPKEVGFEVEVDEGATGSYMAETYHGLRIDVT